IAPYESDGSPNAAPILYHYLDEVKVNVTASVTKTGYNFNGSTTLRSKSTFTETDIGTVSVYRGLEQQAPSSMNNWTTTFVPIESHTGSVTQSITQTKPAADNTITVPNQGTQTTVAPGGEHHSATSLLSTYLTIQKPIADFVGQFSTKTGYVSNSATTSNDNGANGGDYSQTGSGESGGTQGNGQNPQDGTLPIRTVQTIELNGIEIMRPPGKGAWDAQSRVIHDCVTGRRTIIREWYPMDAEALAVIADRERVSRNAELERQRRSDEAMAEAFAIGRANDELWLQRNPLGSVTFYRDGSTPTFTSQMRESTRLQLEQDVVENRPPFYYSMRLPRRYSDPSEDLEQPLYYGTGAIPLKDSDWPGIRASRLAEQAEAELSFNIALAGVTFGVPGPEDAALATLIIGGIWVVRAGKLVSVGAWKAIARNDGPALELQQAFSGKPVQHLNGKHYIEEFELDGVYFDRVENGVLGEVKGDYGFAKRIGLHNPNLAAIEQTVDEARRQVAIARKHGLPLEWHVSKNDLDFFKTVLRDYLKDIRLITYPN
ncbi:MAG: hypothetical protein Q8M16_01280, partial [Pirellulaceae bacterium]|nr:hypothetical protein [Pirellulaceae bacterium]